MRVLLTNDDGLQAEGLESLRRELLAIDGVELDVIAPDSNRSATARSITTRSPLWVEEVPYEDGTVAYATEGTPVDCVRFADLGLVGGTPDLIVSGINHGSNLGDDVTYSGTVAAAFEGIILGVPAIAFSQQSIGRDMDFRLGRRFDFSASAPLAAEIVRVVIERGLPEGTLLNVNFPGGEMTEVEVTRLGKRIYNDELKKVESDGEVRHRYRIYGFEPSFEHEPGTDLTAISEGRVAITPIHFDLTSHDELDAVREWALESLLPSPRSGR